ncbi:hypothetical protein J6590_041552 [Homalodisca vitripennis]|nr:hypothetical protein J6590_041552 [Homalodisca vitripennis]
MLLNSRPYNSLCIRVKLTVYQGLKAYEASNVELPPAPPSKRSVCSCGALPGCDVVYAAIQSALYRAETLEALSCAEHVCRVRGCRIGHELV